MREIAPQVPADVIRQDLEMTGSVNLTITNIFEGRVQIPEPVEEDEAPVHQASPTRSFSADRLEEEDIHGLSEEITRLESSMMDVPAGFGSSAADRQKRLEARKKALQQQSRLYVSCHQLGYLLIT